MKNKKVLFIIIGVILVAAGLLCFFLWPKKDTKTVYIEAMKKSLGFDVEAVSQKVSYEELKDKIQRSTAKGSFTINEKSFDFDYDFYIMLNKMYLNLKLSNDEKKVDMDLLFKDNKLYFTVKDMLENYYYVSGGEEQKIQSLPQFNYDKLLKIFSDNFKNSIDSSKIEVSNSDRIIKDIEYGTKKYSYKYTGSDIYNLLVNIINDVKNDKELHDQLASLIKVDGSMDFDTLIEYVIKELAVIKNNDDILSYTMYLKGDEVISSELALYIPATMSGDKKMSVPVTIVVNKIDKYYEAYLSAVGYRMFEFVADGNDGKLSLSYMGTKLLTGTINDNRVTIKNADDSLSDFEISIEKDELNNAGKIEIEFGDFKGSVNLKGYEDTKEFPNIDVSGALPYKEATGKDKEVLDQLFPTDYNIIEQQGLEIPAL